MATDINKQVMAIKNKVNKTASTLSGNPYIPQDILGQGQPEAMSAEQAAINRYMTLFPQPNQARASAARGEQQARDAISGATGNSPAQTVSNASSNDRQIKDVINQFIQTVPASAQNAAKENLPFVIKALHEEGILTPNVLSYALATIQHETASTFKPIEEYGGREQARRLGYSGGENYYGRGFIQLTHDYNYKDVGERIGLGDKLLKNPSLALKPDVSAKILAAFFKDRGVASAADRGDFYNARVPVNGYDKAGEIANYAQAYRNSINNIGSLDGITDMDISDFNNPVDSVSATVKKLSSLIAPTAHASEKLPSQGALTQQFAQAQKPYTVKQGDTLWDIAERTLGSGDRWRELGGYYGDPTKMPVGATVTVPPKNNVFTPNLSTPYGARYVPPPPTNIPGINPAISKALGFKAPTPVSTPTLQSLTPTLTAVRQAISQPSPSRPSAPSQNRASAPQQSAPRAAAPQIINPSIARAIQSKPAPTQAYNPVRAVAQVTASRPAAKPAPVQSRPAPKPTPRPTPAPARQAPKPAPKPAPKQNIVQQVVRAVLNIFSGKKK